MLVIGICREEPKEEPCVWNVVTCCPSHSRAGGRRIPNSPFSPSLSLQLAQYSTAVLAEFGLEVQLYVGIESHCRSQPGADAGLYALQYASSPWTSWVFAGAIWPSDLAGSSLSLVFLPFLTRSIYHDLITWNLKLCRCQTIILSRFSAYSTLREAVD